MVAAVAGLVDHGLGDGGVEHLADRVDPHEALLLEGAEQRGHDRLDLGGAVGERAVARVEHRQQPLDERARRAGHLVVDAALRLLAEVVEVGRGALVGVAELVALGGDRARGRRRATPPDTSVPAPVGERSSRSSPSTTSVVARVGLDVGHRPDLRRLLVVDDLGVDDVVVGRLRRARAAPPASRSAAAAAS